MLRKKIEWKGLNILCSRPTGLRIYAKILHVLFHIRLTFTTLLWKRNRVLLGRPSLVTEYRKTIKFVFPVWSPQWAYCFLEYAALFWESVTVGYYGVGGGREACHVISEKEKMFSVAGMQQLLEFCSWNTPRLTKDQEGRKAVVLNHFTSEPPLPGKKKCSQPVFLSK
jgi:hypothetical protein